MAASVLSTGIRALGALLGVAIALYAARYAILGEAAFQNPLRESFLARPWAIITHAGAGALALFLGVLQMSRTLRTHRPDIHRWSGRAAVIAALISGSAGLLLAVYSYGGWITHLGFGGLAVLTLICPIMGWRAMRAKDTATHRAWMMRTFALLFAAVTLRIELTILSSTLDSFLPAYQIVSWLCWVPNILITEFLIRRS